MRGFEGPPKVNTGEDSVEGEEDGLRTVEGPLDEGDVHIAPGAEVRIGGRIIPGDSVKKVEARSKPSEPGEPTPPPEGVRVIQGPISGGEGPVIVEGPVVIEGDVIGREGTGRREQLSSIAPIKESGPPVEEEEQDGDTPSISYEDALGLQGNNLSGMFGPYGPKKG